MWEMWMGQKLVPPMGVRRPYKFSYYGCVLKYGIPQLAISIGKMMIYDIWQLIHLYKIGVLFPNNPKPKPWPIPEWMVISNINHKPKGVFHAAAQISWKSLMAKLRVPTQELLFHLGKDISDNPILAINLHAPGRCDVSHCPRILSLKQKGIGVLKQQIKRNHR